jgi:hypothetical protein
MKRSISAFAICLTLAGAPAFAQEANDASSHAAPKAVKMSEAQLDNVVAGQLQVSTALVAVQVGDVTVLQDVRILNNSVNNNTVQVPVAATVGAAVGVLGNAAAVAHQFGASATH